MKMTTKEKLAFYSGLHSAPVRTLFGLYIPFRLNYTIMFTKIKVKKIKLVMSREEIKFNGAAMYI